MFAIVRNDWDDVHIEAVTVDEPRAVQYLQSKGYVRKSVPLNPNTQISLSYWGKPHEWWEYRIVPMMETQGAYTLPHWWDD